MESVLRSFDIVTALAQARGEDEGWEQERVRWLLGASPAEHTASLQNLVRARLAEPTGVRLLRENLLQFLVHGVPHAAAPGCGSSRCCVRWRAPVEQAEPRTHRRPAPRSA